MEVWLYHMQKKNKKQKWVSHWLVMCLRLYQNIFHSINVMRWYDETKCEDFLETMTNIFSRLGLSILILFIESSVEKKFQKIFWNTIKQLTINVFQSIPQLSKIKFFLVLLEPIEKIFFESKTVIKTLQKNKIKNWFYLLQILFSIHWRMKDIEDWTQYSIFQ